MQRPNKKQHIRTAVLAAASGALTLSMLLGLLRTGGSAPSAGNLSDTAAVFEQTVSSLLSTEPARYIRTLSDSDLIAPVPNPDCYGTAASPAELTDILNTAADALNITSPLFTADTPIKSGTDIQYYLDESIFAVTWKQTIKNCTYKQRLELRRFFTYSLYAVNLNDIIENLSRGGSSIWSMDGYYRTPLSYLKCIPLEQSEIDIIRSYEDNRELGSIEWEDPKAIPHKKTMAKPDR